MEWLNYHHLYYFWRIAREGGLSRAAEQLHLTHSTLSAQLRALEDFFGGPLFERRGRGLVLTALGEEAASYADDIFRLGSELVDVARGRSAERRLALRVGIVGWMPKSVAYRLLQPGMAVPGYRHLVARQDRLDRLVEELCAGRLHFVLADSAPQELRSSQRVYAHVLGESGILLYGSHALAKKHRPGFPKSLAGAPMLLPSHPASLRKQLDRWFVDRELIVEPAGEFDDAGLMRVAGAHGQGLLPVRAALKAEVEGLSLEHVGQLEGVVERYYVLSLERRVRHPAVSALIEKGRQGLAPPTERNKTRRRS